MQTPASDAMPYAALAGGDPAGERVTAGRALAAAPPMRLCSADVWAAAQTPPAATAARAAAATFIVRTLANAVLSIESLRGRAGGARCARKNAATAASSPAISPPPAVPPAVTRGPVDSPVDPDDPVWAACAHLISFSAAGPRRVTPSAVLAPVSSKCLASLRRPR